MTGAARERPSRRRLLETAHGTRPEAFGPTEWGLLSAIALIWGSSFLWMEIGLDAFSPALITLARIGLGAVSLAVVPKARQPIAREDWPRVAVLGVVWMAVPLLLFPIAQQWVDSAVAGMVNGAMPLFTTLVAIILLRTLPRSRQLAGLIVGFIGVVAITVPNAQGLDASAFGVGLLVLAVACYGVATNVAVPLQQRYGSLPVLLRAQLVAVALVAPFGLPALGSSTFAWGPALAMVPLGVLSTGLAFVAMTNLVGRAGASRGAVAIYFVPVVAIVLGVTVRGESVHPLALAGTALVLVGAGLTSRRELRAQPTGEA